MYVHGCLCQQCQLTEMSTDHETEITSSHESEDESPLPESEDEYPLPESEDESPPNFPWPISPNLDKIMQKLNGKKIARDEYKPDSLESDH